MTLSRRIRAAAVCLLVGTLAATYVAAQDRADRSRPPALEAAPQLKLPPLQKRTLANGLPVWLMESHEVPLVQINLVVQAGSGDDPAGKFGVGSLTAAMLDEGAGSRSALEISDAIDFLGAELATTSSFDSSAVRLNVPVAKLAEALEIMADVALRPTFPETELNRLRQERITALLQARDDPASVAPMSFARLVFGPTHRYGTAASGTEATLKAFTPADLRSFHTAAFHPANAALIVVGDVSMNALLPQLERHFAGWRQSVPAPRTPVPAARQLTQGQVSIVDLPNAEQSQIRIGWIGAPRATPDFFPLQVLNTILGGSFTSRLNQNLREKNGYAYGAGSRFDLRLSAGPFFASAGVQTDKTSEALREFFNELDAIGRPVPAEELAKAKNYVALGFPSQFEAMDDLSAHLEEMFVYKLPEDYFDRYIPNIQAVTADAVQKAAATYIQPRRFAVVIVGDRKTIEPGIRALNIAPVRVMTVDEVLGQ